MSYVNQQIVLVGSYVFVVVAYKGSNHSKSTKLSHDSWLQCKKKRITMICDVKFSKDFNTLI